MRTLEEINERLSFYRNSDYRWVRELTTEFEKYFDKEFREFLSHKNLGGMTEAELKEIFLFSLNTLYRTISSDEYCLGDVDEKLSIFYYTHYSQHPARDEQISLNKKKVRELLRNLLRILYCMDFLPKYLDGQMDLIRAWVVPCMPFLLLLAACLIMQL